ncbi:pentapeptide repeat-containing protein [Coleofasciculus sp. H7-2]|uniref:pentapeptide repeat-containing protein n=1 Tax=Coleofasciculus sp. H7-2 TaxID=3351545 RepID=UPI00366AC971
MSRQGVTVILIILFLTKTLLGEIKMPSNSSKRIIYSGQNIQGWHFSQESLQPELRNIIAGQPLLVKAWLLIVVAILCITSGIISSFFGAYTFLYITLQPDSFWIEILWMILVVIAWIITTIRGNVARGLLVASIVFFIALLITALVAKLELLPSYDKHISSAIDHSIQNMIVTPLGIVFAIISLISGSLAIALISTSFKRNKNLLQATWFLIIMITSLTTSITSDFSEIVDNKTREPTITVKHISTLGGTISSFGVIAVSVIATNLSKKYLSQFEFLRNWAIAVSSWGSTSFYDLDLSGIDFTEAKLANTDLRTRKLYRTCLQGVTGLDRARVDNRYLDLTNPKVQKLLTHGCSEDTDFSRLNLQGAYVRNADMRHFKLIETNLNGADLQGADLRGSILVRAQVTGVDFTRAILTGICIEDWSVNNQTCFATVECDYIYRRLDDKGEPTDRYPVGRNFEAGEFEALFQEVGNVVELVFKEGVNWRALSFTLRKFQLEDEGLDLELKGVEQRGDLWVVKVTHKEGVPRQQVEERVNAIYDEIHSLLTTKEQQINKLLGIAADQAEALKESSKRPFGNSFFIVGSTITNLAGSGQIDYDEASSKIRSIVANGGDPAQVTPVVQSLLEQLQRQSVANTANQQAELIQQIILTEARKDPFFKQFFVQQGQQIADAMPESAIATAIREAKAQLS